MKSYLFVGDSRNMEPILLDDTICDMEYISGNCENTDSDVESDIDSDDNDMDYFSPDCSDGSDEEADSFSDSSIADDLLAFYINFNISVAGMNFLLQSLNKRGFKGVPSSLYRLKKMQLPHKNLVVRNLLLIYRYIYLLIYQLYDVRLPDCFPIPILNLNPLPIKLNHITIQRVLV